jgi:catechol 2,3-dioxygenase-like lactoylglutathione lyase family enzyme
MGAVFNHLGQCVTDIDRSRRFYEELFGFTFLRQIEPPDDLSATLLGLDAPIGMTACYLERDGLVLELLHFAGDGSPTQPAKERVMNVDDIAATCRLVPEYGGQVLTDTDIGAAIFVRDPDGQLVELLPMSYRESIDSAP